MRDQYSDKGCFTKARQCTSNIEQETDELTKKLEMRSQIHFYLAKTDK